MIDNKKYTVGWICAITTEFVAAQAFLDSEHETEGLEVAQNDNNSYALGQIGLHHVVIAVMPDGEYGNTSAAMVGRDMLHSFPNVRVGLMVGIAGGAPSARHDIRLGDIVVSRTDGPRGIGGVFCYDFGKSVQNQPFEETGFLNQPPVFLRTNVAALRATYERKGHQLEKAVEEALKGIKKRTKYSRPSAETDRLYKADIVHPPGHTNYGPDDIACRCGKLCGSDPDLLVPRTRRTGEQDDPAIHYGIIASGNQLMQDAHVRDLLVQEKDVLCFEMEAAGLMNHFPCLVIRGICDYSDSHKNKEWQGFAAMMAAAYAKDLLRIIPHQKVELEKPLIEVIEQSAQEINSKLAAVQSNVSIIRIDMSEAIQEGRERHEATKAADILKWLPPPNAWHPQTDFFRRRQEGTGQWFLDCQKYQNWIQCEGQTLFCPGLPGAGKTFLTSTVVNDLCTRFKGSKDVGIAFLYCQFGRQEEQTHHVLLASILKQLSQRRRSIPDCVRLLYEEHEHRGIPSSAEILSALKAVATIYSRVFIVIDALDELSDSSRVNLLSGVFALQACSSINILATSRFNKDIEVHFSQAVTLEIRADPEDIRHFVNGHIHRLPSFVARDLTLQEEIQKRLAEVVDGMSVPLCFVR